MKLTRLPGETGAEFYARAERQAGSRARRKRARPAPLERYEMLILAQYLDTRKLLWLHPPNEAKRSPRLGAELKRLGLKPGAPDVLLFTPPPGLFGINGVAIELKRRNGTASGVTLEQRQWHEDLRAAGWKVHVAFGADDAIAYVESLYGK